MNTDKTVYFVRHGQSEDNVAPVFQSPDSPLSEKGRAQGQKIAERASRLSFDTLISSPFPRAKETAGFIAKATGKNVEHSDLFIERTKPSAISGKSHEDKEASRIWREWNKSLYTPGMRVADGENFDDIIARADKALAFLAERSEQSILVVTHAYFLRTMIARVVMGELLTAEAFVKFQHIAQMENTGLSALQYHAGFEENLRWRLWIYNDHSHLG